MSEYQENEENGEYTYSLIRKNVKNINLSVKSDGSIVVSASPQVPRDYIDDFVHSKIPFIQKARIHMEEIRSSTQKHLFQTGEQVPYLGSFLTLQTEPADRSRIPVWIEEGQDGNITHLSRNNKGEAVFCREGYLYLYTQDMESTEHKQQLYDSWQQIQTGILCRQLSRKYYPFFQKLGVDYPEIKIRKMRSRWGSCIPVKHKITFNSRLLEKSMESIEYVVVHEFSHFIHLDHSKAFYNFVEQIMPDWRKRKEGLR